MKTMTWYQTPRDGGQIVERHWAAAGEAGAICRIVDRATPGEAPRYTLHRWLRGGEFAPWNGRLGVRRLGRRITEAEAEALLSE